MRIKNPTYRHDAKNPVTRRRQSVPRPPILRREDLRRIAIQHRIRDIAEKAKPAIPPQQRLTSHRRRRSIQKHPREYRSHPQRPLPPKPRHLYQRTAQQRARDAQHSDDERVAVGQVGAAVAEVRAACGLDVGEEGVVEWVAEADEAPDDAD